jgi:hypothetical protein
MNKQELENHWTATFSVGTAVFTFMFLISLVDGGWWSVVFFVLALFSGVGLACGPIDV